MLAATQNTSVTVYRGTYVDQYGDVVDSNAPLYTNVPAFLAETGKTVQDPATQTPRTVRQVVCHVPDYLGVTEKDRIKDQSSGAIYMVIGVTKPPTLVGAPVPTVLDLKRVTSYGT